MEKLNQTFLLEGKITAMNEVSLLKIGSFFTVKSFTLTGWITEENVRLLILKINNYLPVTKRKKLT